MRFGIFIENPLFSINMDYFATNNSCEIALFL